MTTNTAPGTLGRIHRLLRSNWLTSFGAALMTFTLLALLTIAVLHTTGGPWTGPYAGLIVALVLPILFALGLVCVPAGLFLYRKQLNERLAAMADRPVYLARAVVVITAINFAAIATLGYAGVSYMGSTMFCGTACHSVMEPEYVAFQRSAHQRVDCVRCHVAPGAQGFIESKLNGTKQLLGVLTDNYHRPIPTPVHNLVPARDTCEQCHWPEKFLGTKIKVKPHYREDDAVSSYVNVLLMYTGGTRPDGESVGIHWHVHPKATVEYFATDERRTEIPWLRVKKPDGSHEVFTTPGVAAEPPAGAAIRTMDCNDCHNRSAHAFDLPEQALDDALAAGLIPRDLPAVKRHALEALKGTWTRDNARDQIRQHLQKAYASRGQLDETTRQKLEQACEQVAAIWLRNNWPDRKLGWNSYPDLAGHFGCFRCHDGEHRSPAGRVVFGPPQSADGTVPRDEASCVRCHRVLSENENDPGVLETFGIRR
ncbi:MAG: NapC/NirT family cytochrome c [Planctomycetes bacterium]|nr:NapC/NirT family cytochrome c [Planctomycetota bacterium]